MPISRHRSNAFSFFSPNEEHQSHTVIKVEKNTNLIAKINTNQAQVIQGPETRAIKPTPAASKAEEASSKAYSPTP